MELTNTLNALDLDKRCCGVVAIDERVIVILLFQLLNCFYVRCRQHNLSVTEHAAQMCFQFLNCKVDMFVECSDMLAHRLHALALQFGCRRCGGIEHIVEIGVIEHCTVHYAAAGQMIEGIARYLFATNENIVASRCPCIHAKTLQSILNHQHVTVEGKIDICRRGNVGEHEVAAVGKHATATALATIELYIVGATESDIDLAFNKLVAPEDYSRLNLPDEKVVLRGKFPCNILLHCQIEWQTAVLLNWKFYINHVSGCDSPSFCANL